MKQNQKDTLNISLVAHTTAKDIIISSFKYDYPDLTAARLIKKKILFTLHSDKPEKLKSFNTIVSEVSKLGYYAFCIHVTKSSKEIHFWIDKKSKNVTNENLLELFLHEVIHSHQIHSENVATKFAKMGAIAYTILHKELREYIKK